ncbi:MAG: type II toxin-antitoxin system VapC family toxin [Candidatus Levybacteria bacterium]|nr:type II toxin-antitoxin system VapC family toxin [Candidatus Levybacteria bacterium]
MRKFVIDSSVIIKWLNEVNEILVDKAEQILHDAKEGQALLLAPELAKYEIGNALLLKKKLTSSQMVEALELFYNLPIDFYPETEALANTSSTLGQALKITYYDAVFLALAKQHDATLITENVKHQGKSSEIKVTSLKDY